MDNESEIVKWYRGKVIFITGATGFMGKVLLEKLIRSCPDVGRIYILIREKKNVHPRDRVKRLMTYAAFDEVRTAISKRKNWIFPIPGDIGLSDLGISDEHRHLLQDEVAVVFHLAATVRFDETLRTAMAINVNGTKALLELSRGMKNLRAFVHVSTAYSNCVIPTIEERIYPPPADLSMVYNYVSTQTDEYLNTITPSLIDKHPNTYTFTKALAEHVIGEYATKLPIVMVRPSIVSNSWREPKPGWIDNYNGPTGLAVASGKGIAKIFYGQGVNVADVIPVDVCINLFIVIAWELGCREGSTLSSDVNVYNCVSGPFSPLTWGQLVRAGNQLCIEYISSDIFMYPRNEITHCRIKHDVVKAIYQTLPAAVADCMIKLSGKEPKFQKYQKLITNVFTKLEYFTTHEWKFEAKNVEQLLQRLSPKDRKTFDFDMTKMNWTEYLRTSYLGIRRFLMKESDDTLPAAKRNLARRVLLTQVAQCALLVPASYAIMTFYGITLSGIV